MRHRLARYPLRRRQLLAVAVAAAFNVLLALGVDVEVLDAGEVIAGELLAILSALGIVQTAERDTTPVDDPRSRNGLPLVELVPPAPHVDPGEPPLEPGQTWMER